MQFGFYFDQTRCSSCYTCVVACKDWHDVPAGPASWMRVTTLERGKFPELFVAFMAIPCYHCARPVCITACPSKAVSKREQDGIVVVDKEACLGKDECGARCYKACSYKVPQFGAEPNAKMQKCDMCLERWSVGKKPVCVAGCPMRALDAGPMPELEAKYGKNREAISFTYNARLQPSVIFKAKPESVKG